MPTMRGNIPELLWVGLNEITKDNLKALPKAAYTAMTHPKKSDKQYELYQSMGNLQPAAEKTEGGSMQYGTVSEAYQTKLTNKTYNNGVSFTLESIDDNQYKGVLELYKNSECSRTLQTLREQKFADLFNNAGTYTGADGVAYAANNHPLVNSASVNDNLFTGGITPDNLKTAKNMFNHILNQAGDVMDTSPTLLVAHPDYQFTVMEVLESDLKALELSNTKNVVNGHMPVTPAFNRYIDGAKWALMDMNMTGAGFVFQRRQDIHATQKQDEIDTLNYYYGLYERYAFGVISPGYGFVWSAGT